MTLATEVEKTVQSEMTNLNESVDKRIGYLTSNMQLMESEINQSLDIKITGFEK